MNKYVFTFGPKGVGKSTLLASLADFITIDAPLIYDPKNLKGAQVLFLDWLESIDTSNFPKQSETGNIYEVDIVSQNQDNDYKAFTFLEMSGEDLENWNELKVNNGELLVKKVENSLESYLKKSEIFVLVADYQSLSSSKVRQYDRFFVQFLNRLIRVNKSPNVLLVITKWDLNKSRESAIDYVESRLKRTFTWLDKSTLLKNVEITPFSIGSIEKENNGQIKIKVKNNFDHCRDIVEWFIEIE